MSRTKRQLLFVIKVGESHCEIHELWEIVTVKNEEDSYYFQYTWWIGELKRHIEFCSGFRTLSWAATQVIMDVLIASRIQFGYTEEEVTVGKD